MSMSPVASLILGFVISWLIQAYISTEQYGLFEWYNVLGSFFITMIPFRLPSAYGRYIAYSSGKEDGEIDSLIKSSTVMTLILVPISGLIAFLITPLVLTSIGRGSEYLLVDGLIFTLGVMSLNLSTFTKSVSTGYREFRNLGISNLFANVVSQVAVIILIPLSWGITALLVKSVILGLFTALFLYFTIKNIWSLKRPMYPLKPLIRYAYPAIISFLFAYLLNEILIRAIFQHYVDLGFNGELGLYGFAVRMSTFVNAFTIGYYSILASNYAEAIGRSTKDLDEVFQWTVRMSFFIFTPLILVCIAMTPSAFLLVFPLYYWAYQYFAILMIQMFFFLFLRPLNSVLSATANTQYILVSSILGSIISGVLMLFLIDYGLLFVMVGYISNGIFVAIFSGIFVKRCVPDIKLGVKKITPISIIGFFALLPTAGIHFLRIDPLLELLANMIVFIVIYIGGSRIFRLVTVSEIRKATIFLPARLVDPASKFLILLFIRKEALIQESITNQ